MHFSLCCRCVKLSGQCSDHSSRALREARIGSGQCSDRREKYLVNNMLLPFLYVIIKYQLKMKFVVAFAALVCVVSAGFGESRCHEGPSYWCENQETATECAAVEFCAQNFWQEQEDKVGGYISCKACTWSFSMIESYVFTAGNEDKVLNLTSSLCNYIPATYVQTCKDMVMEYGKFALSTIEAKLNPQLVCTAMGQCDKTSLTTALNGLPKETTCAPCKQTMAELKQQTGEMFRWWQSACSEASNTAGCVTYSEMALLLNNAVLNEFVYEAVCCWAFYKLILGYLEGAGYWCENQETATECAAMEFCAQNFWQEQEDKVGGYISCKACTWSFSMIESYVFTAGNEDKVLNLTSSLCNYIPATYVQTCKDMVMEYGKFALSTIEAKLNPQLVCTAMGQCDKTSLMTALNGLPKETTCAPCKQTMAELKQQTGEMFRWWQSACSEASNTSGCVTYSEMALLLNNAVLNEFVCEEMEMGRVSNELSWNRPIQEILVPDWLITS
eukprot:sb/3464055/